MREPLRQYGWYLAIAGLALMVPAAMVGTWAFVLVAGATVLVFAYLPGSRDKGAEAADGGPAQTPCEEGELTR